MVWSGTMIHPTLADMGRKTSTPSFVAFEARPESPADGSEPQVQHRSQGEDGVLGEPDWSQVDLWRDWGANRPICGERKPTYLLVVDKVD